MRNSWIFSVWLALMAAVTAQEAPDRTLPALRAAAEPLAGAISEIDRLTAEMATATSEQRREELAARIEGERERVEQFRSHFRDIVGGAEASAFEEGDEEKVTMQEQFSDLLDPLVGALREPTEKLRAIEDMRKALEMWTEREEKAKQVIERIENLAEVATDERVQSELQSARGIWNGRRSEAAGEAEILRLRIGDYESNTPTMWESFSSMFAEFWKTRGFNLLLAILAAITSFIAVKRGYHWLRKVSPIHRKGKNSFGSRASDLVAMFAAILTAIISILLVLYLRGDWLLLTLAAVLLIGAAWAGKTALPPYIEQIRMLLNMGTVREGERLIYNGLPWKVKTLGFFTIFTNPDLAGGDLRVPLRDVMGMISRDADPKEPWFPSKQGDWVLLTDGTYGKVIRQTPEQVIVLKLGGSMKTYPTGEFLEMMPENLSCGFRIQSVFGLDYSHQAIVTGEAVEYLAKMIEEILIHELGREGVVSIKVEFQSAAASSLDLVVLADFNGELASRYRFLERRLQRIWVDACNERGWIIPFTQVTVHQAPAASAPEP